MHKRVKGVYRDGKVDLAEIPADVTGEARVIVVFVDEPLPLDAIGIDETVAAALRGSVDTFASEWNSREMDVYDNYDEAKARL